MVTRRKDPAPRASRIPFSFLVMAVVLAFVAVVLLDGCASPGAPIERKPLTAQAIGDLTVQQVGNAVALSFTMPEQTTDRQPLTQPLAVEIFREFAPVGSSNPQPRANLLVTIPPAMVSNYVTQGRFHYSDELRPEDFAQHPNSMVIYDIRTRASGKRDSAPSNVAAVRIYPLPEPIADLKAEVTHNGMQLTWTAPTKTPIGPAQGVSGYRVYRALVLADGTSHQPTTTSPAAPVNTQLIGIADTQTPGYFDPQIQFGNTYTYAVRSLVLVEGHSLESGDSNQVTIEARDIFPPAAPQGLLVVPGAAQGGEPPYLELSWNISPETDLAGYNVYRSEQSGVQGTRINSELLPTPAFRDMNAILGRTYFYSVTAVDRSGNESAPSAQVSGEAATENPAGR